MIKTVLVTGAGGFIGGHLVGDLLSRGHDVVAVDIKDYSDWHQVHPGAQVRVMDMSSQRDVAYVFRRYNIQDVYNLAADMGGMGFIETHKAECMLSVLISTNVLYYAQQHNVSRYFYSSSACVYAADKQIDSDVTALKEADAYPAMPEDGYGWEKLFSERMVRHFMEDYGIYGRVARFHNVYGPCFDEKTEVLTDSGWKLFADLSEVDSVATLNPVSNMIEYQLPVERQSYWYEGDMYQVKGKRVDQLVTPDHSIYASFNTTDKEGEELHTPFKLIPAQDSRWDRARMRFTSSAGFRGDDPGFVYLSEVKMSDGRSLHSPKKIDPEDFAEFMGWYISEGSAWKNDRNYTVNISQNLGLKQDSIVACIKRMGFSPYVNGKNIIITNKQLYGAVQSAGTGAGNKRIPMDILSWNGLLLDVIFRSLMAGDGNSNGKRYTTKSKMLADDFQELCLKLNKACNSTFDGECYRLSISDNNTFTTKRTHRSVVPFKGTVYDVTVPKYHILLVRRNGKMVWSGNCGTYDGGREKAPAAICRKVIRAQLSGDHNIEIWGDGEQTRSFMYIDDCIDGIHRIVDSHVDYPVNLGSSELISINELVTMVEEIAGIRLRRSYNLDAPKGVRGRNSDNTLIKQELGWEPSTTLRDGMEKTYAWIWDQMNV